MKILSFNVNDDNRNIKQINGIFNNIDLNFINNDKNNFLFTYDSKFNDNATPPYRSNLDRFYTNINKEYNIKIINILLNI